MLSQERLQAIQHGTPEGVAAAIKRTGEAQLAAHLAAGGETPPTIRELYAKLPPHFIGVFWRHFWNGQRYTRTHLFRDYPERGYLNRDPSEGKSLCGESIPDYYITTDPDHDTCKRCKRIAERMT